MKAEPTLTDTPTESVLVIEAGRADDNSNIRMPYGATYALNTSLLWQNYVSQPEPALANKTWNTRVAQVLGGGSVVNGMMYDRGSAADYNAWEALGNEGWGWEGMYPFFQKGTEFIPPPADVVAEFDITWDPKAYVSSRYPNLHLERSLTWEVRYGKGPLKLGISDTQYPDIKNSFKAYEGTGGVYAARDGNNGEAYGTSWYPNTMNPKTGERSHARNSYYEPVMSRSNLKVLLETVATELVFDNGIKLTAKGVKVTDKKTGSSTTYFAKKEVVLAAGAVSQRQYTKSMWDSN
jgi:choline dehydrogenase-like flavoprotein